MVIRQVLLVGNPLLREKSEIVTDFGPDLKPALEDPKQLPELIEYVLVNGVVTIEHGVHTGALAGKPLRHKSAKE